MNRRCFARALSAAALVAPLAVGDAFAASPQDAPEYSPLPPPPPPPAEPGARATRAAPVARPAPSAAASAPAAVPTAATTTSSGSLPAPEVPPERPAAALDDERFSVSPLLGFGTNNMELGAGVRAGVGALAPHLWIGATFVFHSGTSTSGTVANVHYESSTSLIYMGPEVGYDFTVGPVVIRPYGGVGPGLFRASAISNDVRFTDTTTKLLLWTGGAVLYGIPSTRFFVGGDARLVTVPAGPAFALYGLGGMTL